jgi:hypothetical protein
MTLLIPLPIVTLEPAYQKPAADPVSQITLENAVIGDLNHRGVRRN